MKISKTNFGLFAFISFCLLLGAATAIAAVDPAGSWRWTSTTDADGALTETPESVGYTRYLILNADLSLLEIRDGEIFRTGTYTYYDDTVQAGPGWTVTVETLHFVGAGFDEYYGYAIGEDGTWFVLSSLDNPVNLPADPTQSFVPDSAVGDEPDSWDELKSYFR